VKWSPGELVDFVSKVLYEVSKGLTLDYSFQKVKKRWRRLDSFKVFYDVSEDVVRNYYFLKFAASILFSSESHKAVAKAWFVMRADKVLYNREMVDRFRKKLLKRAVGDPSDVYKALEEKEVDQYLSIKYSYHIDIVRNLLRYMSREEVERVLKAGNSNWIWLRVVKDVDKVVKVLEKEAEVEPHPEIPFMYLVKKTSRPIQYLTAVKNFWAIPQDISSVYVVLALNPQPGESIIDLAAAPGMKTSLIIQLTEGRVKIVAVDLSAKRVARMKWLLKKLGMYNYVEVVRSDSRRLKTRRFDKALLDAPCTSSGAFTKEPAAKIYPRVEEAYKYSEIQAAMLKNALAISDAVTYAVCSILPQEGEEVVAKSGGFVTKPLPQLSPAYWGGLGGRTFPHLHRGEAFFIANVSP
jgi:16S rRNA (cytosine967-C5)-methyltransferase